MKLTDAIKKIFRRKHTAAVDGETIQRAAAQPLRIEGVKPAPLTPEPDDAELAAQALLETMVNEELRMKNEALELCSLATEGTQEFATAQEKSTKGTAQSRQPSAISHQPSALSPQPSAITHHTSEYYHTLADRIRTARTAEARLVMRLLASVEEQLAEPTALYRGQWGDTERKLYRALDIAEREGGELHRRWQHCLAEAIVRQMKEERENAEADAALIRQPDISSTSQPEETTII